MIHVGKVLPWAILLTSCASPHPRREGEWSLPAAGLQARFQFEAGECVEGVTLVRTFVELRNVSDQGGPLYLLFSQGDCLRSELLDAAGRSIEMSGGLGNLKVNPPYYICIPCGSSIRLDLTAYGYSLGQATKALIGLFDHCWEIREKDSGPRFLRGTFTAKAPNEEFHERLCAEMRKDPSAHPIFPLQPVWAGTLEIPGTAIDMLR